MPVKFPNSLAINASNSKIGSENFGSSETNRMSKQNHHTFERLAVILTLFRVANLFELSKSPN